MILSCGEALIDMLPRRSVEGEKAFAPCAGGAALNCAIALGRLGVPAGLFTGLSTDMFGAHLCDTLTDSKVAFDLAIRFDLPTTLAFVQLVEGQAKYAFFDENTAGRMILPSQLPKIPTSVEALLLGGISLIGEPCGATYEVLMQRQEKHQVTMIDPNIRPSFITDEAAFRARLTRMLAMADIVKVSDEDLHWIYGPGDLGDLAKGLLSDGAKVVLVTQGASGATGYTKGETLFVAASKVDVVDTVGAGDTFNAGVLASLFQTQNLTKQSVANLGSDSLRQALDLGIRAAAVTVSRAGANPPWASEL
ncbi:MAG: carbohydrate kinase [Paracoccaceae bacterium]